MKLKELEIGMLSVSLLVLQSNDIQKKFSYVSCITRVHVSMKNKASMLKNGHILALL